MCVRAVNFICNYVHWSFFRVAAQCIQFFTFYCFLFFCNVLFSFFIDSVMFCLVTHCKHHFWHMPGLCISASIIFLPWSGFSTHAQSAQSPWMSQLVLLTLQLKPMPMMVFCLPATRLNSQKYWPPLMLLPRPRDYTQHGRKRRFRILATVHCHLQFTCRPVDRQSKQ